MNNADPNGLLNLGGTPDPTTTPPATPPATGDKNVTPPSTDPGTNPPPANQDFKSTWKEYIPEDLKDRA